MPFLVAAKSHLASLPTGSTERLILEYLLKNGVGRLQARPWPDIHKHLVRNGLNIRQQTFQQGLLKKSRSGDLFIGSNDHGDGRGYFLIQDKEDAEIMKAWYKKRIRIEQEHLDHLEKLMKQQWP